VAGPDALNPRPTRAFLGYSQARGLLLDPARVRKPKDKPHVESGIRYSRERWWKGGRFLDLVDSRQQAEGWCRDVAGMRVHGTTRRVPRVVFEDHERLHQAVLNLPSEYRLVLVLHDMEELDTNLVAQILALRQQLHAEQMATKDRDAMADLALKMQALEAIPQQLQVFMNDHTWAEKRKH